MFLTRFIVATGPLWLAGAAFSQSVALPVAPTVAPKLPVREVTIFKDGHAFVLHEGALPVGADGEVVLDDLPAPVVGTFWPYAVGGNLRGVVASRQMVNAPRKALSVVELLRANIGAEITVIESRESRFDATILDVPQPTPVEVPLFEVPENASRFASVAADSPQVVLLQTKEGVRARALNSIGEVIFKNLPRSAFNSPETRNSLRLQLEGAPRVGSSANVGLVYLQKGLRWIPNYRLSLDGAGRAQLKMQATLANELVDLKGANINLVVGVPSFAFKEVIDPMALQSTFARLSPLFEPNSRSAGAFSNNLASQSYNLSNSIGSQVTGRFSNAGAGAGLPGLDDDAAGAGAEDFYLYPLKNISLKKGERMVFPLSSTALSYEDIYVYETPAAPPADIYRYLDSQQRSAATKALTDPTVMHKIRLLNDGKAPLTTAPALIESRGQLLAQTMMTYTAVKGRSDIDLAPAVDVTVKRRESEVKRTPNAVRWQDNAYSRIDVTGRLMISSFRAAPISLELAQQWIGTVDTAGEKGAIRKLGLGDDEGKGGGVPTWANYDGGNWIGLNGVSAVNWAVKVPAKGRMEIAYTYHYFAR